MFVGVEICTSVCVGAHEWVRIHISVCECTCI